MKLLAQVTRNHIFCVCHISYVRICLYTHSLSHTHKHAHVCTHKHTHNTNSVCYNYVRREGHLTRTLTLQNLFRASSVIRPDICLPPSLPPSSCVPPYLCALLQSGMQMFNDQLNLLANYKSSKDGLLQIQQIATRILFQWKKRVANHDDKEKKNGKRSAEGLVANVGTKKPR